MFESKLHATLKWLSSIVARPFKRMYWNFMVWWYLPSLKAENYITKLLADELINSTAFKRFEPAVVFLKPKKKEPIYYEI